MHKLLGAALGSALIAGSLLFATPAQAVTQHCDASQFPNKIETSGDSNTVTTSLDPGTYVCLKVGTKITYASVDYDGTVSNIDVFNTNGKLKAISYYAWGSHQPS